MFKKAPEDICHSFISKLDYWQTLNLTTTLLQAQTNMKFEDARIKALTIKEDELNYLMTQAISAPRARHDINKLV
ncbi:hypothetical protein [Limosilactobacillus mucosae]|jgi:hypothetical protein|uniref:hypothetical protein n=1 Tax=Limosilactobacillus mucosae TaxID=97478 RepID=UPI000ECC84FF|nr:hypothetical protein [Limosilactobacillus mucosae]HAM87077.1 hypothetical protein [Lactobacillus sp.]